MRKTPQEFKRTEVKKIIEKVLGNTRTNLVPISICVSESLEDDFTITDFSFEMSGLESKIVTLNDQRGKGFVDGLFTGLHHYFVNDYNSLEKLKLADYNVNPIMKNTRNSMGTDAQASVSLSVAVGSHGIAEFHNTSRSMIYSSFHAALEAFQFYINCDRTFDRIQLFVEDAKARNRSDVMSQCVYDLSKLTEVNTYERSKN